MQGVRHDSNLTHPNLVLRPKQAPCRERQMYFVDGTTSGPRSLKINDPNISTLKTALLTRMFYCEVNGVYLEPPSPSLLDIRCALKCFNIELKRRLSLSTRISPEEFVGLYKGRKRTIYNNALDEYYECGVLDKHARSVAFVKCEKVNPTKAPRCIQPRHPVYNIALGRYLKHVEHKVYKAIDGVFGSPTIMKGYNVVEVGGFMEEKWNRFAEPVAVGLDATKFDMHVSASMLKWEHQIYLDMYANDRELRDLLRHQINNVGSGHCDDGSLSYKVQGRRFSGDMNTAMGNCLIMCAMVYSYALERGVVIELANNGDDCVVFMEKAHLKKFMRDLDKWFLKLGFRMTVEPPVWHLAEIEFCQMHPIRVGGKVVMVRNIEVAREKDSISIIPLSNEKLCRKWMYCVGECGLSLCGGVPIMQEMYSYFLRSGESSNMRRHPAMCTGMSMLARGLKAKYRPIDPETRADVFTAWGITPDEQLCIETHFNQLRFSFTTREIDDLEDATYMAL